MLQKGGDSPAAHTHTHTEREREREREREGDMRAWGALELAAEGWRLARRVQLALLAESIVE